MDIHQTTKKLESAIKCIEKDGRIIEKNKSLILKFKDKAISFGLSMHRVLFYVIRLTVLARSIPKGFDEMTMEDMERTVSWIETSEYESWTKHDFKVTLKKFFQWLRNYEWYSKEYPPEVRWIKTTLKSNKRKLPEDILTKEEVRSLIQTASNPRDKAFISVLYESGCRIGEIMNIKRKNVSFDKYGAQVIVPEGKTGPRRIRLIQSISYLEAWLGCHPRRDDPEAPLWVTVGNNNKGKTIGYQTIRKMLRQTAEKAGIKKRVNPHAFRHARATHLASELTMPLQCEYFGWVQGSKAPATYIHLSGKDLDRALLKMYGKLPEEEENNIIKCPRCNEINQEINRFCSNCGLPFDLKGLADIEDERGKYDDMMSKIMVRLTQNPQVKKEIMEALKNERKIS
jgi:integrase